jgi:diguanylate cyclase (GGDEF)-like protein
MGQDLSGMEKVRLEMSATYNQQPITDQALRLHVKNYDGDLPENARIKTNHIEFFLTNDLNSIDLPFAYLQVADWWKQDNQIPLEKSFADVSEVQYISIATPSNALAGEYRLTINKLDVVGPWIASQHLYLLLLCSWIFAAVVYLVYSFATTKQKVSQLTEQNSELKQSHRHIEHLASIDTLTGALNRRGANRVIDKLGQSQFGILYIDLDHFKRLNDDYGHEAGDRTLRQFSEMMMSLTDNNSHFVRWGGEEFLILIEFATQASCIKLAQSIQTALLDSTQFDGKVITCSIGVAINIQNQPFEQVLSKADNALYIAKNRGRNCIQAA